jgi:hypothetical protein
MALTPTHQNMPHIRKLLTHIIALGLFSIWGSPVGLVLSAEEEEYIQIQYRTFGWGVQASLMTLASQETQTVLNSQFSMQKQYIGPKVIRFHRSSDQDRDYMDDSVFPIQSLADSGINKNSLDQNGHPTKGILATPPVLAEVTIPRGMKQVLFIFFQAPPDSKYPMGVIAIDDSIAQTENQNVHFYNLTPITLVVKTFDQVNTIAPQGQSVWELNRGENQSSIAIAITNPETKLLYSTRYRMREDNRIIVMARLKSRITSGETPEIHVSLFTEKIQNSAPRVENDAEVDTLISQ